MKCLHERMRGKNVGVSCNYAVPMGLPDKVKHSLSSCPQ